MKNNGDCYTTTLRIYGASDKKLLLELMKEFGANSLNPCIIQVIRKYYQMKKQLENIKKTVEKNVKVKYELPEGVVNDIIDKIY